MALLAGVNLRKGVALKLDWELLLAKSRRIWAGAVSMLVQACKSA